MADLPPVNPNAAFQNNVQGSQGTPVAPVQATPATPVPNPLTPPVPQPNTPQSNDSAPPTKNLEKGAKGADVQQLQNYLVQMGYLTSEQVSTGSGTYGPQTTAAVAKLQQDLGINAGTAAGKYGPQTQAALAQKYKQAHEQLGKSGTNVDQSGSARNQLQNTLTAQNQPSSDPVFNSMSSAMEPIMASLGQVLQNINNPALTATSLQTDYNEIAEKYKLPEISSEMMNLHNIMDGTQDDIRAEITKAGGFATESQVQGMAAARNNVILKKYNALSTQYAAAQANVENMMKYATTDQATQLQRQTATASVTEAMASIYTQMQSTAMTMQEHARSAAQYNVTQMGYKGLAESSKGNPEMQSHYENLLGLAPGSLSDPKSLAAMDTYKDQTLQLQNYKAAITAYSAGYASPNNSSSFNSPMSPTNPGGSAQGLGTWSIASGNLISPSQPNQDNSQAITKVTGMSLDQFNYLTQGQTALTRIPYGRQVSIKQGALDFVNKKGVDMSTFQSSFKAYNDTLQKNISRFNNTKIAEGEVSSTLQNLDTAAYSSDFGSVNMANVAKVLGGQQVNDPKATEYSFYFNDLINSLAYFYAAQQGKSSAEIPDKVEAASVIQGGLAKGGIQGLQKGMAATTQKMEVVLGGAVDSAQKNIWDLFGVGEQYHPTYEGQSKSYSVNYGGQSYEVDGSGNMTAISGKQMNWGGLMMQ